MTDTVLSIVTPLYNRDWCIADCIESVGLHRLPADSPCEMIVVDDGSTDGSVAKVEAVVARLGLQDRVRLIRQPNAGASVARNLGANAATGRWLVFLDSDDLWYPWSLGTLLNIFATAPDAADLAFLNAEMFADRPEPGAAEPRPVTMRKFPNFVEAVEGGPASRYGACNAAIRKDAFLNLGGFAPELQCAEDTDLFLRVSGAVVSVSSPVLVALRRAGHDSLTGDAGAVAEGFDWKMRGEREGRYVGSQVMRRKFLAGSCAYAVRAAFAAGHPGIAYRLYFGNLRLLLNARTRKYAWRLPLTPILHLRKRHAYPFRWRPKA